VSGEESRVRIEIEVSDKNEATASPWWFISDPRQMMRPDHYQLAGMITGPFFSREEAEDVMNKRSHHYSERAAVFCASGCYTHSYDSAYRAAEKRKEADDGEDD